MDEEKKEIQIKFNKDDLASFFAALGQLKWAEILESRQQSTKYDGLHERIKKLENIVEKMRKATISQNGIPGPIFPELDKDK